MERFKHWFIDLMKPGPTLYLLLVFMGISYVAGYLKGAQGCHGKETSAWLKIVNAWWDLNVVHRQLALDLEAFLNKWGIPVRIVGTPEVGALVGAFTTGLVRSTFNMVSNSIVLA